MDQVLPTQPSAVALFRFFVISQVHAQVFGGQLRAEAVANATKQPQSTLDGRSKRVSARSVYRWLRAYEAEGLPGLEPKSRKSTRASKVLSTALTEFFVAERKQDPGASVPELLRRAQALGIIENARQIDRSTAWRTCKRLGLPTSVRATKRARDMRRYAYPHRMQMMLCDGKHFRAGPRRAKRLALFFFDDATRKALHVIVGTSETTELFLTGFYQCIRKHGLPQIAFLDGGSGFKSGDTHAVFANLKVPLIHGEAGYPEGRGKIERFNRTAEADVLRGLAGSAHVDDNCASLTLRLQHYLDHGYNPRGHSAHGGDISPDTRWAADERALNFPESDRDLRAKFVATDSRTVSADNVISFEGTLYEVPRGHAKLRILIYRELLTGVLRVLHDGRLVRIEEVDVNSNAHARRARADDGDDETLIPPTTAAALGFDRDFGPMVGPDGGFTDSRR